MTLFHLSITVGEKTFAYLTPIRPSKKEASEFDQVLHDEVEARAIQVDLEKREWSEVDSMAAIELALRRLFWFAQPVETVVRAVEYSPT